MRASGASAARRRTLLALAFAAALAALPAYSWAVGISGALADGLASDLASRRAGLPVQVLDVSVRRWSVLDFGVSVVRSGGGRTLIATGPGRVRLERLSVAKGSGSRYHISLKDLAVLEEVYRRSKLLVWTFRDVFRDPIYVSRLEAVVTDQDAHVDVHLYRFDSPDLVVLGGLRLVDGSVGKANLLVLLPEANFEGLPKEMRARMIRRRGGWYGVRVTFADGHLTVHGRSGPFFKARWR